VVHVGGRVILFELPDELPGIGRPAAERAPAGGGVVYLYRLLRVDDFVPVYAFAMRSTMVLTLLVFCFYDCVCAPLVIGDLEPAKNGLIPHGPQHFLTY